MWLWLHPETSSCGAIAGIIPDLIEIGMDVLNPIQPNCPGMKPSFAGPRTSTSAVIRSSAPFAARQRAWTPALQHVPDGRNMVGPGKDVKAAFHPPKNACKALFRAPKRTYTSVIQDYIVVRPQFPVQA